MKQIHSNPSQASLLDTLLSDAQWLQRVARALVGVDAADDLQQEVMIAAMKQGPREFSAGGLRPWLRTVARRAATRHRFRRQASLDAEWRAAQDKAHREASGMQGSLAAIPPNERLELHEELAATISSLRSDDRDLIVWRYFEDQSVSDVAQRLNLSADTARKRLSRALARLRAELQVSGRGSKGWCPALVGLAGSSAAPMATQAATVVPASALGSTGFLKLAALAAVLFGGVWMTMTPTISGQRGGSPPQTVELPPSEMDLATALSAPKLEAAGAAGATGSPSREALSEEDGSGTKYNVFEGRVIDERRFGVPGVQVWLSTVQGDHGAVQTDSEGRFRVDEVPLPEGDSDRASLRAMTDDGRGCVAGLFVLPSRVLPGPIHVDELILVPVETATVLALEGGVPAAGARVVLQVGKERSFVGVGTTDNAGRVPFPGVPRRSLWARADVLSRGKAGYGKLSAAEVETGEPMLTVHLEEARNLRVQVFDPAHERAPIEGAEVTAQVAYEGFATMGSMDPFDLGGPTLTQLEGIRATTGPDGVAILKGLPPMKLYVRARHPMAPDLVGEATAQVGASAVDVALAAPSPNRRLRFPITIGAGPMAAPAPPEGTVLELTPMPGGFRSPQIGWPAFATVHRGHVVVEKAPGGRFRGVVMFGSELGARLFGIENQELGHATEFLRTTQVKVRLENPQGEPMPDIRIVAHNQGNNAIGKGATTDEKGEAVLTDLFGGLVSLYAAPGRSRITRTLLGSVELERGATEIVGVMRPPVEGTLAFLVDGLAMLPPDYRIQGDLEVLDEDPARGLVRFLAYPKIVEGGVDLGLRLPREFLVQKRELTSLELEQAHPIPVAISRAGILSVTVTGDLLPDSRVVLDRREVDGSWQHVRRSDQERPSGEDGAFVFGRLGPGQYRARHSQSGFVSPVATFDDGGGLQGVPLNLKARQLVHGTVLAPKGARLSLARIRVEDLEVKPVDSSFRRQDAYPSGSQPVSADGSFEFFLPEGAAPTLRVWHPLLSPAPEGGEASLEIPSASIQLQLVSGPTASLPSSHLSASSSLRRGSRVLLLDPSVGADGDAEDAAAHVVQPCPLVFASGRVMFGGFAPGRYSLWIDPGDSLAPVILPDVELGEGETVLGDVDYSEGAQLRIKVKVAPGASAPRIHPVARSMADFNGMPLYMRQLNSSGESEVILSGLGPGRFSVGVRPVAEFRSPQVKFDLTLQSGEERVLEVDLTGK